MRRTDRETTREEAWRIFDQSAYSVLSMSYRNRPYATALSVARIDETLYFHAPVTTGKIRAMREKSKRHFAQRCPYGELCRRVYCLLCILYN